MLNRDFFEKLPIDALLEIFSYLSPEAVANATYVNKKFKITAHDNLFWQEKLHRHFLHIFNTLKIENDTNWYAEFRKAYDDEYKVYDKENKTCKALPANIRKLFSLVKEGDIASLDGVLKLTDLDQADKNGISLLDWAKKTNNQSLLNYVYQLVVKEYESGITVDITKTDQQERTILHWGILCHQPVNEIDLLILQGADINAKADGCSPLSLAARKGQAEIAEMLINHGAPINTRSWAGATALLFAIEHGHKNVVDVLLKHNADVSLALQRDSTPHQKLNLVVGDTPLHAAIKLGRKEVIQDLLNKDADINAIAGGLSPLSLAARKGQAEIAEMLINHGAPINTRSWAGATALLFAIEHGHKNVVDVLLKHNADVSLALQRDATHHQKFNLVVGDTPLHAASKSGRHAIVRSLLMKNANIKTLNNQNQTPVDVAAKDSTCASELKLLAYSEEADNRPDNHYKTSFTIFGHTFNFGYSAKQKKDAKNALINVRFHGASPSCLDAHQEALNNGQLKSIYHGLKVR